MEQIKYPKCGTMCDSTDGFCRVCGHNLKANSLNNNAFDDSNNINNSVNIDEPSWIRRFRNSYKKDKKNYMILAILASVVFLTFLPITFLDTYKDPVSHRIIFDPVAVVFTVLFGLLTLTFFLMMLLCNPKDIYVQVVDGYYVVGYGQGSYWKVIIEGKEVGSVCPPSRNVQLKKPALKATLPNEQQIIVLFENSNGNIDMKIKKINGENSN